MDKEIIDKIMFDNFLKPVPTMVVDAKDRKTISTYGSIDVNDLMSAIDRLKKVPNYGELLKQVKKQKEVIDKAKLYINSTKYSDITGLEKHSIKEFWFIEELLDILNEVSE